MPIALNAVGLLWYSVFNRLLRAVVRDHDVDFIVRIHL
jgi:hypothetical protein